MVVFILAAGYATRLFPYTLNTPKPLLKINDKHIIDYITDQINMLPNVEKIVVISNNKFYEQFETWKNNKGSSLISVLNDGTNNVDDRLGAIGDIQYAINKECVDNDLIVIAGDNIFTYDLSEYYEYFKKVNQNCVCVKEHSDIEVLKNLGVCEVDKTQKVIGFTEKPEEPKSNTAVYATYMFKKDSLYLVDEYLKDGNKQDAPGYFIEWLYKKTDVYAYVMNGDCYDIGTVEAYENIQRAYKNMQ